MIMRLLHRASSSAELSLRHCINNYQPCMYDTVASGHDISSQFKQIDKIRWTPLSKSDILPIINHYSGMCGGNVEDDIVQGWAH